ncbi:NADP:D-xylose dehydrogenase [Histoplasma ohiense]|nr:NADP:D-xylose dehydrogenase [Histoplasma ohiense (nom. inval.)]
MAEPYNIRWGFMATGGIARSFARDMLIDPSLRNASDISHTIAAVASSTSRERAQRFITDNAIPQPCTAHGSYEALVNDPDVDIVYIATPHSHHFQNAMLALSAGKHVLCEKALTVNAAQARILVDTARRRGLFFMEAVWTRFFPLSVQIRELVAKGEIGEVLRVIADTSCGSTDPEGEWGTAHRMVNMDLAGGVLLDVGVYSLTWVFQTLYHTRPLDHRKPPSSISSQMIHYPATGADECSTILLEFPQSTPAGTHKAQGIAMTNFRLISNLDGKWTAGPTVRIQGTRGEIQVFGYPFHPDSFKVIPLTGLGEAGDAREVREVVGEFPGEGKGMYWEADEAARCVRDGKLESETMSWEESLVIMDVMDEARRQGGLKYPDEIESTEYPVTLGGKKGFA